METIIQCTKSELIKALELYNKKALDAPENFGTIDFSEDCARNQVDNILECLSQVRAAKKK